MLKHIKDKKKSSDILKLLTKPKGADYQEYIDKIVNSENIHAMNVKLSDLRHNMDLSRIKNPTVNDYERVNKRYAPAYTKIQQKINEINLTKIYTNNPESIGKTPRKKNKE